jgi:ubiquinone/menaquinone biosynthesis C-methylase UbiE
MPPVIKGILWFIRFSEIFMDRKLHHKNCKNYCRPDYWNVWFDQKQGFTNMLQTFNRIAETYDQWYDRPKGRAIFNAELRCIQSLYKRLSGQWLEVGIGTGRFASKLQIEKGIDPSVRMLGIAKERGISVCAGQAENLPFPDNSFDGVLLALALCFIATPYKAIEECRRILRSQGNLLAGVIPSDSPWGDTYSKKKAAGHSAYASANFLKTQEILSLMEKAGFTFRAAASTLFWSPGKPPEVVPRIENGIFRDAGFIGLLYTKNNSGSIPGT